MRKVLLSMLVTLNVFTAHAASTYGVYLVAWDYKGPVSSYYREWGGTKPHATIAGFAVQPRTLETIVRTVAQQSREESGRWTFNCVRNDCWVTKDKTLRLLKFFARTISYISDDLHERRVKSIKSTDPIHITLCKLSEKSFNVNKAKTALERARNWRLVIARSSSGRISWGKNYAV